MLRRIHGRPARAGDRRRRRLAIGAVTVAATLPANTYRAYLDSWAPPGRGR
jgi:hypothetical protein